MAPRKWRLLAANSKEHPPPPPNGGNIHGKDDKSPPEDPTNPPQPPYFSPPSQSYSPPPPPSSQPHSTSPVVVPLSIVGSVCFLIALSLIYWYSNRTKKVASMPLMIGLTRLLTKELRPPVRGMFIQNVCIFCNLFVAFVNMRFLAELLALRRLELEAVCEGFNNIVGSFSNFTLYKGTLSSGAEVAVMSTVITSTKDWSAQDEAKFMKKVSTSYLFFPYSYNWHMFFFHAYYVLLAGISVVQIQSQQLHEPSWLLQGKRTIYQDVGI